MICITTHQPSHHHPIAHHHPVSKDIFQDSARLITQTRKTTISSKRTVRTATTPGARSRGDLRESKDSPLPIPCGPGASEIQVKSYRSSPCGTPCTVHNEPGRRTRFLPPIGRCMPSQPQNKVMTWIPEPQEHPKLGRKTASIQKERRAARLPALDPPRTKRATRQPALETTQREELFTHTPHHLIKRDC